MSRPKERPERNSVRPKNRNVRGAQNSLAPHTRWARANQAEWQRAETERRLRLRHLTRQIHPLGARPLYEMILELDRGADLHETLERYGAIAKYASFVKDLGGDRLDHQLHVVDGCER